MFISQDILEGKYDACYNSFIHTLKTDQDQKQLLEFMENSKVQCISAYEKRFREYEQIISSQHPSIDQNEPETIKLRRINMMYTDLNMLLSEKLQASLLFGSIVYSLCDYWLKQEKGKVSQLQLQFDRQQSKNSKHKQEVKCFAGMCKSKDDFIQQLKQRVMELQESLKQVQQANSVNSLAQTIQEESLIDPKPQAEMKSLSTILGGSGTDDSVSNECDMYAYSFGKIFRANSILSEEEDRMIDENKEEVPIQQGIQKLSQNQVKEPWPDKISFFNSSDSHSPNSQFLHNQLNHNKTNALQASSSPAREMKKALSQSMSSFSSNKSLQFSANKLSNERMNPQMSHTWNSSKRITLASPEKPIQTLQNDLENMSGKKQIKEEKLFHLEIKSPRRFIIHNLQNISKKQQVSTSPNNQIRSSQSQERI